MKKAKSLKTNTLTLRLNSKTRFMLEFVARLRGQNITTVFERAIEDAADQAILTDSISGKALSWKDFWDIEDGITALNIAKNKQLRPSYEDEKMLEFTNKFWPFFYTSKECLIFERNFIKVLWFKINDYIQVDEENCQNNFWAAAELMEDTLIKVLGYAPDWKNLIIGDKINDNDNAD